MGTKLTEALVKASKTQGRGRYYLFDDHRDAPRGFGLRVSPNAQGDHPRRVFVLRYKHHGTDRLMTIGEWPTWSVEAARAKAKELRREVDDGTDPLARRRAAETETQPDTLGDVVARFLRQHTRDLASGAEIKRALEVDVLPTLGKRPIAEIRRKDVIELLEGKAAAAPKAAARTLKYLKQVFAFAEDREIIEASPIATLKPRTIDAATAYVPRERVLDDDEIRAFWAMVETCGMHRLTAIALKLVLVTGQRPGEVAGMCWSEISGKVWTIPGARRKTREAHTVPLTDTARALLDAAKAEIGRLSVRRKWEAEDAVFAARRTGALTVRALSKVMGRYREKLGAKGEGWTPHDLRRTCRTRMAAAGVSDEVAERVIGHMPKGIIGTYNLHRYDAEKRTALEAWERALLALLAGEAAEATVTPITKGRKS